MYNLLLTEMLDIKILNLQIDSTKIRLDRYKRHNEEGNRVKSIMNAQQSVHYTFFRLVFNYHLLFGRYNFFAFLESLNKVLNFSFINKYVVAFKKVVDFCTRYKMIIKYESQSKCALP